MPDLTAFTGEVRVETMTPTVFIILALPRSMTAWVSTFLTGFGSYCLHDTHGMTAEEIAIRLTHSYAQAFGVCDSGMTSIAEEVITRTGARVAYLRRDPQECCASLEVVCDVASASQTIRPLLKKIERLNTIYRPEEFSFDDLKNPNVLRRLWNFCTGGLPLPEFHIEKMLSLHIEVRRELMREAAHVRN